MKIQYLKHKEKKPATLNLNLIGGISFVCSFLLQILMNLAVISFRSLPDEMGAMALAARAVGFNWTEVLTNPSFYYGSAMFPFMYPFFKLVNNPLILYQCLLGIGALLRAVPAYLSCKLMVRYFNIKSPVFLFFSGMICTFFTPTRSTNIDNEPILILLCWIIFYLLVSLQYLENDSKKKKILSFILAFMLCYSFLAHTRAVIYTLATIGVVIIYKVFTKKWIVNLRYFVGTYICGYLLFQKLISKILNFLYPVSNEPIKNTVSDLKNSVFGNLENLFAPYGIQSFFDLLASNIWIIFVFSGGIVFSVFGYLFIKSIYLAKERFILKSTIDNKELFFSAMFCVIGVIISLGGLCVLWLQGAISQHISATAVTRGYFYLRYYGNFFGPIVMMQLILWEQESRKKDKINYYKEIKIKCILVIILFICVIYCEKSYLKTAVLNEKEHSDWFYYFAPLTLEKHIWPKGIQDLDYFIQTTLVTIIIFLLIYLFLYKNKIMKAAFIMLFLIYQYSYLVFLWDKPYCNSENYYGAADAIYKFRNENYMCFETVDKLYYYSPTFGAQYTVQYLLPDISIVPKYPPINEKNILFLTTSLSNLEQDYFDTTMFKCIKLDNNEYLLIKGAELEEKFKQQKIALFPLNNLDCYE